MAAPLDKSSHKPHSPSDDGPFASLWKRLTGKGHSPMSSTRYVQDAGLSQQPSPAPGLIRRVSRKVVPGLPRAKTFKRQQSEVREKLEPVKPTTEERRAVSVDRRLHHQRHGSHTSQPLPRASAPDFLDDGQDSAGPHPTSSRVVSAPQSPIDEKDSLAAGDFSTTTLGRDQEGPVDQVLLNSEVLSTADAQSMTTSRYDEVVHEELEKKWILNLSMHFRDKSRREKFFVTYRERGHLWRRVTISLDYRNAPEDSLERDLLHIKFQREKSSKIYEAIRESLQDIQFYETVTNLKLQTTDGRLHVHVVEDVNEIIHFPTVHMAQHLRCRRIREQDIEFDSHMSGFVYKVRVGGQTLIKKEIPGPDTVDEFLYEVNALNSLRFSRNIIEFFGVVVDDDDQVVKGLLISYADQGALIDMIYDSEEQGSELPWETREKWARQIVQGLSDIHEAGFVQGDFTLSNIVIDDHDNAKIIDINRRGCPVGWEPPEASPLIASNQRISMYIGVKSDLYQLGMVLWALATMEDEPEAHRRPLHLNPEIDVPLWYRRIVENCLHENPRVRLQATALLAMFPDASYDDEPEERHLPSISVDDGYFLQEYLVDGFGHPHVTNIEPRNPDWSYASVGNTYTASAGPSEAPYYHERPRGRSRGRSPPSPSPSNRGMHDTRYTTDDIIWPSSEPVTEAVDNGKVDNGAGMPTNMQATTTSTKDVEDEAQKFERDLQSDLEIEQAEAAGGNSQPVEASLGAGLDQTPVLTVREAGSPPQPPKEPAVAVQTIQDISSPPEAESLNEMAGVVDLQSEVLDASATDQKVATPVTQAPDEARGLDEMATESIAPSRHSEGDESDTWDAYSYERTSNTATRTEANTVSSLPPELTGIGSAHDDGEKYRQTICSDEDLGLSMTTGTQNVSSHT